MPPGLSLCVDYTPRNISGIGQVTECQSHLVSAGEQLLYLLHLDWNPDRLRQHGAELITILPQIRKPTFTCWKSSTIQAGRGLLEALPESFRPLEIDPDRSADVSAPERMCMRYLLTALATADRSLLGMKSPKIALAQIGMMRHGRLVLQFRRSIPAKPTPKPTSFRQRMSFY